MPKGGVEGVCFCFWRKRVGEEWQGREKGQAETYAAYSFVVEIYIRVRTSETDVWASLLRRIGKRTDSITPCFMNSLQTEPMSEDFNGTHSRKDCASDPLLEERNFEPVRRKGLRVS